MISKLVTKLKGFMNKKKDEEKSIAKIDNIEKIEEKQSVSDMLKTEEVLDLKDKESVLKSLSDKHCSECLSLSFSKDSKTSEVSDSGKYIYVQCPNCNNVMKLTSKGVLESTKNTLREISEAYELFSKVNMKPREYSYSKDGRRFNIMGEIPFLNDL